MHTVLPESLRAAGVAVDHTFRPGDLGALIRLHGLQNLRDYGFGPVHEAYCAKIAADYLITVGGTRGQVWLARRATQLVGSVFIVEREDDGAQLRLLFVDAVLRGRGLGRWLVEAAVDHCRRQRFARVVLWTVAGLDNALAIYHAVGFRQTAEKRAEDWGRAVRELRLELRL